jgi:hypothetical protein
MSHMSKPGECIRCGEPVGEREAFCPDCKANMNRPVERVEPVKERWWHTHPDLTYILGIIALDVLPNVWMTVVLFSHSSLWIALVIEIPLFVAFCWLTLWYLRRKRRDPMWGVLVFVPFGWAIILALRDNTPGKE